MHRSARGARLISPPAGRPPPAAGPRPARTGSGRARSVVRVTRPDDTPTTGTALRDARAHLVADCSRCRALCCVGPAFTRSADFPIAKPAGTPCPNLLADHRCGIHDALLPKGFRGCVGYDCFGAGQHLSASGADDEAAHGLLAAVRLLRELEWYLLEVLARTAADGVHGRARSALGDVRAAGAGQAHDLRGAVAPLLREASDAVRGVVHGGRGAGPDRAGADRAGADLAGRDLRGADLRRGSLRGALLLGTDLRGADLRDVDLLGADTRGADLRGADLRGALFGTRPQLDASRGDGATRLPTWAARPAHWAAG